MMHAPNLAPRLALATTAAASVDLTFTPLANQVSVGETVSIEVHASASTDEDEAIAAIDLVFAWDPSVLNLLGIDNTGGGPFLSAELPTSDIYGLNESDPPTDGDALFTALSMFGSPFTATADGDLVTTLIFEAIGPAQATPIEILIAAGSPTLQTRVISGTTPGLIITGDLFSTEIAIAEPGCTADLDGDGNVDSLDLNILLGGFGCDTGNCDGDINTDGATNSIDLNLLLEQFGCTP